MEAQSPFLPGTKLQFAWDSTSLNELKTCPRKYQYTILEGWRGKSESIDLRFGQEYHTALQQYDVARANGVEHEDALVDVIRELHARIHDWDLDPNLPRAKYKNKLTLFALVIDYLDTYGEDDPAKTYIKSDGQPAVELSFRFELDWGPQASIVRQDLNIVDVDGNVLQTFAKNVGNQTQPYLLCGHLDRVVEFNGGLLVMDHKTTTKTLSDRYFDQWEPNNQMSLYTIAGKVVLEAPIKGVVISAAQIMLDNPNRFVRGFTYRTPDQSEEWLSDLAILLDQNESYVANDHWPMNDLACDKYGGCPFRTICSKASSVRDKFLRADFVQLPEEERWNPLRTR